jgi:hypothetical protein
LREYIIPNWHAIMVHTPLGLLTTGLILEILTLLWRRSSARMAARWMILIGAVTAVPAMTSGIYAYHDVISPTTSPEDNFEEKWTDLMEQTIKDRAPEARSASETEVKEIEVSKALAGRLGTELKHHIWRIGIALGGVFLVVITFIGCSDFWRRRLYVPLLLLLIASQALMINGAHNGGMVVYEQGAAVQPLPGGKPVDMKMTLEQTIKQFVPPAQFHFTAAGWMVGLALIALALSIRAIAEHAAVAPITPSEDEEWFRTHHDTGAGPAAPPMMSPVHPGTFEQSAADAAEGITDPAAPAPFHVAETVAPVARPASVTSVRTTTTTMATPAAEPLAAAPSARLWLLTLLAGVVTFIAGLWQVNAWRWNTLMDIFHGENRNAWHILVGTSIIVLTLVLMFLARFARRAKAALTIVALLLFAALTLQIYVGVLLTFDSPKGPSKGMIAPLKWNVPKKEAAMAPPMLNAHQAPTATR